MTIQSYAQPAAWSADYRISQQRPAPTPRQPHLKDRFDHLFDLSETVAELRRRGCPAAASFREAAYVVLGDWLDGAIDQDAATAQLAGLLADARQALADDDALRADQLADAREHCRATLATWGADPWDSGSDADEIAADVAGEATRITRHTAFRCECGTLATRRAGGILFCNQCWVEASALCPSCGDALTSDEPRCAACRESDPVLAHTGLYKTRSDGWPLCPNCGEDELWSPLIPNPIDSKPPISAYIAAGLRCYRCDWNSAALTLPRSCTCGAEINGLISLFGPDLDGHITKHDACGGELHIGEDGAACITCGWYGWGDDDGNTHTGNRHTGERSIIRGETSLARERHFNGYSFTFGPLTLPQAVALAVGGPDSGPQPPAAHRIDPEAGPDDFACVFFCDVCECELPPDNPDSGADVNLCAVCQEGLGVSIFRCESCGDVLTPDRIIPYCAACQEAGEAEIAAALAAPVPPELLAAVGRAREQALDEACRLMEQWRAPACRESEPAHTCYGLAANCGKPAAHRVDMPGMVMWLCGWCYADWGGADPAPLTLPQAIALAVGDPAPPVDDGEEDNWGGFRSPRQVGG